MEIVRKEINQEHIKMPLPDLSMMPNYFVVVVDKDNTMEIHIKGDSNLLAYGFADAVANNYDTNQFFMATHNHLQEMGKQAGIVGQNENP